jgi:hypothetical protein
MRENHTFTISGLKRKRGEIAGQIMVVKGQLRTLQDDLAAIDRSLGLLDPSIEPRKIKVLRPTHRFKYFEAGELAKLIFDQLRKAEGKPVLVPAITEAIMDAKGWIRRIGMLSGRLPPASWPNFMGWRSAARLLG